MKQELFIGQVVAEVFTWQKVAHVLVSREIGHRENISFFVKTSDGASTVWTQPFFTDEIEAANHIEDVFSLSHMRIRWNRFFREQTENREKIFGKRDDEK